MPAAELIARQALPAGETSGQQALDRACDMLVFTVARFDNGADELATAYYADGVFLGGGGSLSSHVETLEGPFADGAVIEARVTSPPGAGIEVSLSLTWG